MRKSIIIILLFIIQISVVNKMYAAGIGTWKAYMAYHEIQQIAAAGNDIFVLASDNLYQYNKNDESITTYDKVNGLSDTQIKKIAWSKTAKRLIVVYENSNIDLVETNGEVTNISDLYTKSMTEDKTVNNITIYGKYAYLATGFGVVKVNMSNAEISESYILGENIEKVIIQDNTIFARLNKWYVLKASVNDNLLDKKNWEKINYENETLFSEDLTDYNTWLPIVSQLKVDGPKYNSFGFIKFINGKLYTVNGISGENACIQIYDGDNWIIYDDSFKENINNRYIGHYSIDVDPNDNKHVAVGGQTGLYEFYNGKLKNFFNCNNSILQTASTVGNNNPNYVMISSVKFDNQSNLWLANSISPSTSLIKLTKDGEIMSCHKQALMMNATTSFENMSDMMIDSHGLLWFVNDHWRSPSVVSYDIQSDKLIIYDKFINQNSTSVSPINNVGCIDEDLEGNIWVGTSAGPLYLNKQQIADNRMGFTQYIVPRNDNSGLGDYLLDKIAISAICIDDAGRKWFGTNGNGVYLISADNNTQIYNFTTENSPLLSNIILSIDINNKTGEVFFGTENGLCSYMSDATIPNEEMTKDNVYAYPNPVTPEYRGMITVNGLSYDADVKITTTNGVLVTQGRSNGGTFIWDGCDQNGKRVASGIYMVQTAKSNGSKGTVCKIAILN